MCKWISAADFKAAPEFQQYRDVIFMYRFTLEPRQTFCCQNFVYVMTRPVFRSVLLRLRLLNRMQWLHVQLLCFVAVGSTKWLLAVPTI